MRSSLWPEALWFVWFFLVSTKNKNKLGSTGIRTHMQSDVIRLHIKRFDTVPLFVALMR